MAAQATATIEVMPQVIAALERAYHFQQPEEVRSYLVDHPVLLGILVEGLAQIPRVIMSDRPITLDVVWDPGSERDKGQLVALIPTRLHPDEARPHLARLDEEWWVDAFRRADGQMNIDLAYE